MSDLETRRAKGYRAKAAMDEFLTPALSVIRAEYADAHMKLCVKEPWETNKLIKLAVAHRVIDMVEQQIRAAIIDGDVAATEKNRAERIAAIPEAKRRWL